MQSPNLGIDPANNLWSSNSPNNNLFSSISSPEASGSNSNDASVSANACLHPNLYPTQELGGITSGKMGSGGGSSHIADQGPQLSADSGLCSSGSEPNAGEVFMVSCSTPSG